MNKTVLLILGLLMVIAFVVAGILPVSDRDDPGVHTEPSPAGRSPTPTLPKGPPTDGGVNRGNRGSGYLGV
jgi:hypothetical protein